MTRLTLCLILFVGSAFAFTMQCSEKPVQKGNMIWHGAFFEDKNTGVSALFPGDPYSGTQNGFAFMHSDVEKTQYEIHTKIGSYFAPPASDHEFLQMYKLALDPLPSKIFPLNPTDPNVRYVIQFEECDVTGKRIQIARVYCTKNKLYYAIVVGEDLSLASQFFKTIKFQ